LVKFDGTLGKTLHFAYCALLYIRATADVNPPACSQDTSLAKACNVVAGDCSTANFGGGLPHQLSELAGLHGEPRVVEVVGPACLIPAGHEGASECKVRRGSECFTVYAWTNGEARFDSKPECLV
jgi:hypothetical protein